MRETNLRFDVVFYCLIGIGSYWAWSGALLITASLWPSADISFMHATWLLNVGTHCVCLLIFGLLSKRLAPYSQRRAFVTGAPPLIIAGTAALFIGYALPATSLTLIGSVVSGIGTSFVLLIWGESCTRLQEGDVQHLVLSGSVVAGLMIILLIVCLPPLIALFTCFALPIVMVRCIVGANKILTEESTARDPLSQTAIPERTEQNAFDFVSEPASSEHVKRIFIRLLLCCFVLALPAGLYQNSYASISHGDVVGSWGMVFSCVCVLVMLASFLDFLFMKRGSTNVFSRLIVPLMAGGLLVLSVFTTGLESWAGVFMQTGYHLFLIYIYTEFSVFASETNALPSRIFALGTCAIDVGLLAGFGLLFAVTSLSSVWSIGVILVVVYLLILVGILVFPKVLEDIENRNRDKKALELLATREVSSDESEHPDNDAQADKSLDKRRAAFSEFYGLSSREQEILDYLLRGRSLRSIATETFLSYNTVKTHVSHIYRKANVHTRDELIDAFDRIAD
ncbi:LuxR C-terminal-related transcriptional regulator [Eggerthella sp. YY7918]|uniref:LuxR C-terminal-related transcriptional regulator n=1 Tax=Eggerthella sp. (strain YY7918) TaxID=502558 RepID=UPI0013051FFA|nr:LuxR C-terminal-related transcriptional regulator [Eggerthella sp. YY7918]